VPHFERLALYSDETSPGARAQSQAAVDTARGSLRHVETQIPSHIVSALTPGEPPTRQ